MATDSLIDDRAPIRPDDLVQRGLAWENEDASPTMFGDNQELDRARGLFSSFGAKFMSLSVASVTVTTLVFGFQLFGPASFGTFVLGGALQVFAVGLAIAQWVYALSPAADRGRSGHREAAKFGA